MNLSDVGGMSPEVVGAKARGLGEMIELGLPVPRGFVLTTKCHAEWRLLGGRMPERVWGAIRAEVEDLDRVTGRTFGSPEAPLLLAVRSGAATSMPGVMDTILNVGIVPGMGNGNTAGSDAQRWLADTQERFARSYQEIVVGGDGRVPLDAWEQLRAALDAVLASAEGPRVQAYSGHQVRVDHVLTAVVVQEMVFGNRDNLSGSGVAISRDPLTGQKGLYGDWLPCSQGDDVVSGWATPEDLGQLANAMPRVHEQLTGIAEMLESSVGDLVEVEYAIEAGQLFLLQVRRGQAALDAAPRIAVELAREGHIDKRVAISRISALCLPSRMPDRSDATTGKLVAIGIPASTGVASGMIATHLASALRLLEEEIPFVLARPFTTPQDLPVLLESAAVITERGGRTSHAAVVCRELGIPCVVGCGDGALGELGHRIVTVNGATGEIDEGSWCPDEIRRDSEYMRELLDWAMELAPGMQVRRSDAGDPFRSR